LHKFNLRGVTVLIEGRPHNHTVFYPRYGGLTSRQNRRGPKSDSGINRDVNIVVTENNTNMLSVDEALNVWRKANKKMLARGGL
jgi:hypothetical protein